MFTERAISLKMSRIRQNSVLTGLFSLFLLLWLPGPGLRAQYTMKTVVIDAGHGGKDPGAIGPGKHYEKDIALKVALKLGDLIKSNHPNIKVIYTRSTDVFIPLYDRANIANRAKADLFISIHLNSSTNREVYGSSTYVLGLHRSEDNLEVAKRENAVVEYESADDRQNYEFDPNSAEGHIIMSMKQNAFLDQSITLASKIEDQYEEFAKRTSRGVKQAGFYVLYKTSMPALLSEIGFISNPTEERFMAGEEGQNFISESLYKAFKKYKDDIEGVKTPKLSAKDTTPSPPKEAIPSDPTTTSVNTAMKPPVVKPKQQPSVEVEVKQGKLPKGNTGKPNTGSNETSVAVNQTQVDQNAFPLKGSDKTAPPAPAPKDSLLPVKTSTGKPVIKDTVKTAVKPTIAITSEKVKKDSIPASVKPAVTASEPKNPVSAALVFQVQLFAIGKVPTNLAELKKAFPGLHTEAVGNGLMRYLCGPFDSYGAAEAMLPKAKQMGYGTAFVIAYKNGVRLSAPETQALSGKP